MRSGKKVNVCDNKFTECDEFLSVDDGFLLGFIIANLHICFCYIAAMKILFSFHSVVVHFVIQLSVISRSVPFAQHKHL